MPRSYLPFVFVLPVESSTMSLATSISQGREMTNAVRFNGKKFRELLLYIAERSKTDPRFGATKLNKLMYYADFAAYRILGSPITGAKYRKLQEGPVPRQLTAERDKLIGGNRAHIEHRQYYSSVQQRIVPDEEPDLSLFTKAELAIVDEVLEDLWPLDARGVSDRSHQEPGWLAANNREEIPYHTAWLSSDPISPEEEAFGHDLAKNLAQQRSERTK